MSSKIVERLLPAAKLVFASMKQSGVQGILLGGAAQAMLGGERNTKDLDINVSNFPDFNHDLLYKRLPNRNGIMQVTYMDPQKRQDISCDVAEKRKHLMPIFLKYSCYDQENEIWYANHALLLADKIRTFSARPEHNIQKRYNDLTDIQFCIEHLGSDEYKMPNDLKALYSANDWAEVKKGFEERLDGEHVTYFGDLLEL